MQGIFPNRHLRRRLELLSTLFPPPKGYAVLRDERTFVANASAWREAALPRAGGPTGVATSAPSGAATTPSASPIDRWSGEGYFGARVRDLGVSRSIDNDYLPVLIARETGIGGLTQTIGLLLLIALAAGLLIPLHDDYRLLGDIDD
jgi:hypothetical protein